MLKSMTGYGKAQCLIGADKYLVEIRSVNGKTADITFKTQLIPRDREPELRKYIAEKLNRGNIDLFITVERGEGAAVRTISRPTLLAYYEQLKPGLLFGLGMRNEAKGTVHPAHTKDWDIDEDALETGVKVFVQFVLDCAEGKGN